MIELFILIGIPVIFIFYGIYLYNNLIRKNNDTDKAFGTIDVMLKKRYDLIPNLIETVKQYITHEATVFSDITKLRMSLTENISKEAQIDIHNEISKKLNNIIYTVENYPDLKASHNFTQLQAAWNETEEQIAAARRYYNTTITEYNNAIQTFPSKLIANQLKYELKKVFEIDNIQRANINAKELFN